MLVVSVETNPLAGYVGAKTANHQPKKYPHANECGGNRLQ